MPAAAAKRLLLTDKIALAQGEMLPPAKALSNPAFKGTKYAGLAQVAAVVEPVLTEHGLAHLTLFRGREIVYRVWDMESKEQIESSLEMPLDNLSGNVWQGIGQGITYLRRYVMVAFWNLIPEDDDGNSAPRRETPARLPETQDSPDQPSTGGGSL
jgi:hypothetical protein